MPTLFSQAKLTRAGNSSYNVGVDGFNPADSESDIPLMSADLHWEEHSANAAADPILYTPKPRVNPNAFTMSKHPRDEEEDAFIGHGHDRQENGKTETSSLDLDSDTHLIRDLDFLGK
jgi:hypothetical protein